MMNPVAHPLDDQIAVAAIAMDRTAAEVLAALLNAATTFTALAGLRSRPSADDPPVRLGLGFASVTYDAERARFHLAGREDATVVGPIEWEADWRQVPPVVRPRVLPAFAPAWGPPLRTCPHCGVRGPFQARRVVVGGASNGGSWDDCTCVACGKTYTANVWID